MALGIFNCRGEFITTLVQGNQTAGAHTVIWNANGMTGGIYIVKAQSEGLVQSQKIIISK